MVRAKNHPSYACFACVLRMCDGFSKLTFPPAKLMRLPSNFLWLIAPNRCNDLFATSYKFLGKIAVLFGKIVKIISLVLQSSSDVLVCAHIYCSNAECVIKAKSANNFAAVMPIAHRYLWALHVKCANIVAVEKDTLRSHAIKIAGPR